MAEIVRNEATQNDTAGTDKDEDDIEIVKPTYKEVGKALGTLKDYLLFISNNQNLMAGLTAIEDAVQIDRQRCMKQATLTFHYLIICIVFIISSIYTLLNVDGYNKILI